MDDTLGAALFLKHDDADDDHVEKSGSSSVLCKPTTTIYPAIPPHVVQIGISGLLCTHPSP